MTLSRVATRKKLGWLRTPVVSLMLRDSVGTFLMLAGRIHHPLVRSQT